MDLKPRLTSLLEAIEWITKTSKTARHKTIKDYYEQSEGSGLPFFNAYNNPFSKPRKKIYRKTLQRQLKKLTQLKLVHTTTKKTGKKPTNHYTLTTKGHETLKQQKLKKTITRLLPSYLETIQARLQIKPWETIKNNND